MAKPGPGRSLAQIEKLKEEKLKKEAYLKKIKELERRKKMEKIRQKQIDFKKRNILKNSTKLKRL